MRESLYTALSLLLLNALAGVQDGEVIMLNVCMILFRRANVFVQLNGSSPVHAQRFMKHLDGLVAPK